MLVFNCMLLVVCYIFVQHSKGDNLCSYSFFRYNLISVTFAATAIFSYWWLIPAVMYGFLWWKKSQAGFTFLEILCVYGYSLAIYIPISVSMMVRRYQLLVAWNRSVLVCRQLFLFCRLFLDQTYRI